ncbi:thiamine pyrophosphate-binding protein [Thauera chlorobenzoica]|uniref:Benzoylformate decarboxylase n=1 Tax=Thauera chlorobenzoica TaxID=96773 RepID=A0A1H5YF23_9RHOO|nr:thiamine pyrophosphate-binding protein [Thauera chlorobenzoica]APR05931.1 Benzoylformate decarboxylase [Thauera chlorobenzoica]SEG22305.1 benzoylformate decarboxylase [Thauera chlorobenzoica]
MTNAAKETLAVLKANGISQVFGNPGTTELPLLDGFISEELSFRLCLHEGVATSMADGYGRASGTTGVVLVHTSVGTANTLVHMINAHSDRVPLLVIAGDKDDRLSGRGCFVEVPDITGLARQFTKAAWRVTLPEKFPELTYRALKEAATPARGPAFLAVPENYMGADLPESAKGEFARPVKSASSRVHPDDLQDILEVLATAERPLLIAGNEVGLTGAAGWLQELAESLAVPVVGEEVFTTNAANFPSDHIFYHGNFSPVLPVVRDCDVVVAFGARLFMEYAYPAEPYLHHGVRLFQVGSDPREFGKIYPVEKALLGAPDAALHDLVSMLKQQRPAALGAESLARRRIRAARGAAQTSPIARPLLDERPPGRVRLIDLLTALDTALPADGVVVDESVLSKFLMLHRFSLTRGRGYFGTSGGGLGWGLGAALGVQLALPNRRVAAFVGDGGTMFSIQGLWSAAHMRLPVVFVVVNNGGYMAVRRGLGEFNQAAVRTGRFPGAWLDDPAIDFCTVARGLGVAAMVADRPDTLTDVLQTAFALEKPVLVDVRIDPSEYY